MKKLLVLALVSVSPLLSGYVVTETLKELSATTQEITLTFALKPQEYLYKESLIPSVNTPDVTLSPLKTTSQPVSFFDEAYKKNKEGYTGNVTFTTIATLRKDAQQPKAIMHTHFMISSDKEPKEKTVALLFSLPTKAESAQQQTATPKKKSPDTAPLDCAPSQPSLVGSFIRKILNYVSVTISHAQGTLSSLFAQTGSPLLRLLAALLLGIMLSLTPCIYPMIPITIGVLQASGSTSGFTTFYSRFFIL